MWFLARLSDSVSSVMMCLWRACAARNHISHVGNCNEQKTTRPSVTRDVTTSGKKTVGDVNLSYMKECCDRVATDVVIETFLERHFDVLMQEVGEGLVFDRDATSARTCAAALVDWST